MEDEDGYMSIDPRRRRNLCEPKTSTETKGSYSYLSWWKIALGISVAGNVAVIMTLILLFLPASRNHSKPPQNVSLNFHYEKPPHNQISSCQLNCIPCRSAKGSTTANLTLDSNTAFPQLYISEDWKGVKWKAMKQNVPESTLRYNLMASVLSHEGFTSGKICWEVEVVEGGEWWAVGVVRKSANRNNQILVTPEGGYWGVQHYYGQYQAITTPRTNLSLCHPLKRIRVSLDYPVGQVAFFDGDTQAELFTFPKVEFSGEKIIPWFLIYGWNGELRIHP